jgi:hypothetical protein
MNQHRLAGWHPLVPLASRGTGFVTMFESVAHVLALLCSEYRRAIEAERRYAELRRTKPRDLPRDDISWRVFAEMYSARDGG